MSAVRPLIVAVCLLIAGRLEAAPPALTGLSPTGLTRGTTATLKVRGNLKTRPISAWCDREDVTVQVSDDQDQLTVTVPEGAPAGRCWVRLFNAEGASELCPLQIGLLTELEETEPNNKLAEATRVPELPCTVNGVLHKSGEVDAFAVTLEAGQQLVAAVEAREALGSPMDAVLQLVSADGFVMAQNDDHHGFDPLLTWTARKAGVVYARLFAFPAEPDSSIRFSGNEGYAYRLTLTTGPFLTQAVKIAAAEEGTTITQGVGWNLSGLAIDPSATPGLPIARPDRLIGATRSTLDAAPDTAGASAKIAPGESVVGRIVRGWEQHAYHFSAQAGETLRFTVEAGSFGSPLDPVLTIARPDGGVVQESDDGGRGDFDVDFDWKVPEEGEYVATVTDRYAHSGEHYVYRLALNAPRPAVTLTVENDRFQVDRSKPLEISVKVSRRPEAIAPLTITLENGPEGLIVTPAVVEAPAEGESPRSEGGRRRGDRGQSRGAESTVKITLDAGMAAAFNGPVRIVARSAEAEQPDATVIATATSGTKLNGVRIETLWLTIAPPPAN